MFFLCLFIFLFQILRDDTKMSGARANQPPPSQEKVRCFWCEQTGRKDNMKKHHDLKHPHREFKWRQIIAPGQSSLRNHFSGQAEKVTHISETDNESPNNVSENTIEDKNESIESPRKRFCSGNDWENNAVLDVEDIVVDTADTETSGGVTGMVRDFKEIVESVSELKNDFVEMLASFRARLVLGPDSEKEGDESKVSDQMQQEGSPLTPIESSINIFAAKDLEELQMKAKELGFNFDSEAEQFTCSICIQDPEPTLRLRDGKVGIFSFDVVSYDRDVSVEPSKQPRNFLNLKKNLAKHLQKSQIHLKLKEKVLMEEKLEHQKQSRNEKVGMNLFNIRYNGVIHGSSYLNFEEDVLTAHLNGTDTGDINNGSDFARDLTRDIVTVMENKFKENLAKPLAATKRKRPVGLVADKITPNKRTGHISALVVPVPENPLSQCFLNPLMLELPPVTDHTAEGLSDQMLELFHNAGADDGQLEGIGVDGQYVKMGAIKKLIAKLAVEDMTEEKLLNWVFETWEPAHNINKADEEVRKLSIFDWLVKFTNVVGDITKLLKIGKGLEQTKEAANELKKRLYKLQAYSVTRFASHVEKSYTNTFRSFEIIVKTLEVRSESNDKKVREAAETLRTKILTTKFVGTLLGCIDVYRVIATASCDLQAVEQFPWQVVSRLKTVIATLNCMSNSLKIVAVDANENVEPEDTIEVDPKYWPHLAAHIEELKTGKFKNLAIGSRAERNSGRIRSYFAHENDLMTVQNRLTTLCKYEAKHIEKRTVGCEEYPYPPIISSMEGCLDVQKMVLAGGQDKFDLNTYGIDCLEKVLNQASYKSEQKDEIKSQYNLFKEKVFDLLYNSESQNSYLLKQYEHILYETHTCSEKCKVFVYKKCPEYMKVKAPKTIISMKILHLFLKFPTLYADIPDFLHLFLRCSAKTHAEGVAESMGNYVDFYSDKKRGLDIRAVGDESYIHWNGPPVHLAGELGRAALDKKFGGRRNWRFVTKNTKSESLVVTRLRRAVPRVPFYQ